MNRLLSYLMFVLAGLSFTAYAALYNIVGTDEFVNGVPPSLTSKERAKLLTTTVSKTESSCLAGKCKLVGTAAAKTKIKAIIAAETVVTPPPSTIFQVDLMPAVDTSKNITPAIGYSDIRIQPSNIPDAPGVGDFRIGCTVSHMNNDDPMVFPNQQGATHHHTYFGNTSINYKSDLMNLSSVGNSTCHGGTANRSAYWIPSMIDTATNTPIVPDDTGFYYKAAAIDGALIVAPPKGLRMIKGNSKAKTADEAFSHYSCLPGPKSTRKHWPWTKHIPSGADCEMGDTLVMSIGFPQCWDGKNLDSPNHQDHMSHDVNYKCPATHPIAIPMITVNVDFKITKPNQTATWRLASDNYSKSLPGGYSTHADWVNGWNESVMDTIIKSCINAKRDCHSHLLGNGLTLY